MIISFQVFHLNKNNLGIFHLLILRIFASFYLHLQEKNLSNFCFCFLKKQLIVNFNITLREIVCKCKKAFLISFQRSFCVQLQPIDAIEELENLYSSSFEFFLMRVLESGYSQVTVSQKMRISINVFCRLSRLLSNPLVWNLFILCGK